MAKILGLIFLASLTWISVVAYGIVASYTFVMYLLDLTGNMSQAFSGLIFSGIMIYYILTRSHFLHRL